MSAAKKKQKQSERSSASTNQTLESSSEIWKTKDFSAKYVDPVEVLIRMLGSKNTFRPPNDAPLEWF